MALQILYIYRTTKILDDTFDHNIESMLYIINEKLEKEETRYYVDSLIGLPKYSKVDIELDEESDLTLDPNSINIDTLKNIKLEPQTQGTSVTDVVIKHHNDTKECFQH
ncbi:MAG: hypothetical protein Q4D14_08105, partial [Bacteroidales bacterium]|nr:hypothetical protein [Bacteroidales bacterium]